MKVAIIGSRNLEINDIEDYLPKECTEIVSGGAVGVDRCAFFEMKRFLVRS